MSGFSVLRPVAAVILALATASADAAAQASPESEPDEWPAPNGTVVSVQLLWGQIRMVGDDGTTVRVSRIAPDDSTDPTLIAASSAAVSVERVGDEIRVSQETPREGFFASSDLEVRFPRDRAVVIEMVRGGEVLLMGSRGDAEVTNRNGSVRLDDVSGPVRVSALNGSITGEISGPLEPSASFASLNGEVDLTLPFDAAVTARLRTDNGRLRSDFPLEVLDRDTSLGTGAEVRAELNGGGSPLIATTRSGDVYLRRSPRR